MKLTLDNEELTAMLNAKSLAFAARRTALDKSDSNGLPSTSTNLTSPGMAFGWIFDPDMPT